MFTKTIYIPLLEEGTFVLRPTQGVELSSDTYEVLPTPDYDSDDEVWEFPPGSIVNCRLEHRDGKDLLIAYSKVKLR